KVRFAEPKLGNRVKTEPDRLTFLLRCQCLDVCFVEVSRGNDLQGVRGLLLAPRRQTTGAAFHVNCNVNKLQDCMIFWCRGDGSFQVIDGLTSAIHHGNGLGAANGASATVHVRAQALGNGAVRDHEPATRMDSAGRFLDRGGHFSLGRDVGDRLR
ncbi:hypothetical protein BCR44DRAFT_1438545, partial [Catenaria anguillulae PL171]